MRLKVYDTCNMEDAKKVRIALYIRVSTAEQSSNFSFETQERDLMEYISHKGYRGWETKDKWIFREQASGSNTDRKELNRLMQMAKKKEFDLVLVWKIDRISRSLTDLLGIFRTLDDHNVGFASYKEDIDFTGIIGKLVFQIFGALAEFERGTIKMRTEEGKKTSALAGNYIGGGVPYGYEKVPNKNGKGGKLKLIKAEGEIVKKIFKQFIYEKKSLQEIAKNLNEIGVPKGKSQRAKHKNIKWLAARIKVILINDIYRGKYIVNRYKIINKKPLRKEERPKSEWIINDVEGVISDSIFFEAQDLLRKGVKAKPGGGKETYMLSQKLIDTKTNKGFVGYKTKDYKNYRRKKFTDKNSGETYPTISIAAKDLETFVWSYVENAVNNPELFLKMYLANTDNSKKKKSLEAEYTICEKSLSKANERIDRVKLDFYSGNIDESERADLLNKFESKRDKFYEKVSNIEKKLTKLQHFEIGCLDLKKFSANMKNNIKGLTYKQKANIVKIMIEKIEISETNNERRAKVFCRFDPKAITLAIPVGRNDIVERQANKQIPVEGNSIIGGR